MSATSESPDVQALRKLFEAVREFTQLNRIDVAIRILELLRSIAREAPLDLSGVEALMADILEENVLLNEEIAARLED